VVSVSAPHGTAVQQASAARFMPVSRSVDRPEIDQVTEAVTTRSGELTSTHQARLKQERALKAAAERARKKAAAERRKKIRALGYEPGTTEPRAIARQMMANKYGWGAGQFDCYNSLIMSESAWSVTATNPSSGAYGIPQSLPGNKMATKGSDWRTNPATQIAWGLQYVRDVYGTPCSAWSFKQGNNWY
jgi:hypothetical protein